MTNPVRTSSPRLHLAMAACFAALAVAGCGDSSGGPWAPPALVIEAPNPDRCDPLDTRVCLFPFPNDFYTVADPDTDTGRRISFARESMPTNVSGVQVDPTEWNRNDGYSPGALIQTWVAGLDLEASGIPGVTDIGRSLREDAPIVLVDADTGERKPLWAELDASVSSDEERALLVRPAVNLEEGHRHVVAIRRLVGRDGAAIPPGDAFRAMRDRLRTNVPEFDARRPAFERIFEDLANVGVARDDLFLAWDFTVASGRSLSERLLHIRDEAFADLGGSAPRYEVRGVSQVNGIVRAVNGTFEVPRYLTGDGSTGNGFEYAPGPDGLPRRNGTQKANFICTVPSTATAANPARAFLYGHGLLGSAGEVLGTGASAALANIVSCATDWIGMASEDVPNAVRSLQDLSNFPTLADRLQQGHLNFLFLGRLMIHPEGFGKDPAFQHDGTNPFRGDLYLLGASQGGILGGATTAVAQDFTRSVLAVGGSNYSLLIPRSIDFDNFAPILEAAYPDELVRSFILAIAQMLWDRGEANGYLQHMIRDEYPNTPRHEILYFEAFGDHQVANVGTETAGRSMDVFVKQPALRPGRSTAVEPMYGLRPATAPFQGSAVVLWDFDSPAPPDENLPPREGRDPHGAGGREPRVLTLVSEFLRPDGVVADVCDAGPCVTPAR